MFITFIGVAIGTGCYAIYKNDGGEDGILSVILVVLVLYATTNFISFLYALSVNSNLKDLSKIEFENIKTMMISSNPCLNLIF